MEQPQTEQPQASPQETPTEEPQTEKPEEPVEEPTEEPTEEPAEGTPPMAMEAARTVLRALQNGDMETVAAWAHKDKGVRFSPYAYVDTEKDLVFSQEELAGLMDDTAVRQWREFAGSGEMIELTYADYHKRFVYDANFMEDAETALNEGLGQGTTINNLNEVYPKETHDFVEFHIAGVDPKNEGMDWRSLRLVFEKIGDDRALVGIVHDQWTP
ncbi:hypothetical protein MO973_19445 [Paenibacillus sp. TRM 82003]|nr:hypothetical protein [Paenibacillus sp. TRM 82003]